MAILFDLVNTLVLTLLNCDVKYVRLVRNCAF